jgi:histidinol-phosphate/aromatic aminotransferase/cobyric acid decarboxylase-like protein
VNVGSAERAAALYAGLKQRGILVRYWGKRPELADKLRITVGPL